MIQERTIPEFHQVEPRLSLSHFPPVEARIQNDIDAVRFVCREHLNQSYQERIIGIYCDNKLHPVCYSILAEGTIDRAITSIQSILTPALLYGVSRIILIHNHPSGSGTPSRADYDFSYNAYHRCKDFGFCLLDSIIMPCGQNPDDIRFTSLSSENKPDNPWHQYRMEMREKAAAEAGGIIL